MNDRERFVACVLGEPVDRPPYWLYWGPWTTTWQRWEREGKPAEIDNCRNCFDPDHPPVIIPVNAGPCPRIEPRVVEEDDVSVVSYDSWGIKRRDFKNTQSMSEFLEFPVQSRADWERFRKERLDPAHPDRLAGDWIAHAAYWREQGAPLQLGYYPDVGLYGAVRWMLGDEECLVAFCTDPDLIHEMMEHMTNVYLAVFGEVVKHCRVDVIHMWEDMCGRQGPLISPGQWRAFMGPHYARIRAFGDQHGIPVLSVDTDGQPELIIPPMMDAGVNLLFPMEVAAGCDVNRTRVEHPSLALMGGIDKRALADGPDAIQAELERIRPAVESGRYIADLDHLIPDDVSWDNYCYYARALRDLVGKG